MVIEYIKCHGSGNEFVMTDAVSADLSGVNPAELAVRTCDRRSGIGADGLLLLVRNERGIYGMRMFNPDGSEAEMCGNGIRCIARLAAERVGSREFTLTSGGREYAVKRYEDIAGAIPQFGVRIGVQGWSRDFMTHSRGEDFIAKVIPPLDGELPFTAVSVGNPHIVALVERIDYALLERLGERVAQLPECFPNGVNVSLVRVCGRNRIFVATYERGAGITPSCGTAMTSSATAATLLGECDFDTPIEVLNRGGAVRCICSREGGALNTMLIGNATFTQCGRIMTEEDYRFTIDRTFDNETGAYAAWLKTLNRDI